MLQQKIQEVHSITLSGVSIQEALDREVRKRAAKQKVPGFRLGMVPLNIVFDMHENEIVSSVLNQVLIEKVREIPEHKGSSKYFVQFPDPIHVKLGVTSDLPVEITFVYPSQFPDTEWSDVLLPVLDEDISEDELRTFVERYLQQFMRCEPLETPRASQWGDMLFVRMNFKDNQEERSVVSKIPLVEGEHPEYAIEEFIGIEPGYMISQRVKIPHFLSTVPSSKALAGKRVNFSLLVEDVQRTVACALDDKSAQYTANCDLKELLERAKLFLKKRIQALSYQIQKEYLEVKIFQMHEIPVSDILIKDYARDLQRQYEANEAFNSLIPEDHRQDWYQEIARCVLLKKMFIKDYALKNPESCTPTSGEILEILDAYRRKVNASNESVLRQYLEDSSFNELIQDIIISDKVMENIVKKCGRQPPVKILPSVWKDSSFVQQKYAELSEKLTQDLSVSAYIQEIPLSNVQFLPHPNHQNSDLEIGIDRPLEETEGMLSVQGNSCTEVILEQKISFQEEGDPSIKITESEKKEGNVIV
ncbi:trigger factor [Holospora curviuscula]|uniref:Trigger factor n=1 Tax=Holospora curviuscula TaxID=1082868 RepID=A0A2S5R718_9PROT|nr:trigger factor [Holospora curviuscula]PPE03100.1 trigger factor [Holospora curviuscula]